MALRTQWTSCETASGSRPQLRQYTFASQTVCLNPPYRGSAALPLKQLLYPPLLFAGWKWEVIQDRQETPEDEDDNLYDYNFLPRRHKMSLTELGPRKGRQQWHHGKAGTVGWANLHRSQFGLEAWHAKPAKKSS
jgi:hypothetical protein